MKQKTVVTNTSDKSVTLNHVSSVCIAGIGDCGQKKWSESGKLVLYYCKYGWSNEAQWVKTDVDKLGNEKVAETDLGKYGNIEEVVALYPGETKFEVNENKLKVEMPDKLSARLFQIKISEI